MIGASLLSLDWEFRNFGYFFFLTSGIFSCVILYKGEKRLFFLNAFFTIVNANGIYQFFIK